MIHTKNIKTGELKVSIEKEEPIWCDRKRILFLGLPWTFTKYILTPSRLMIQTGFWKRTEEEIRLYRITDITMSRSFGERLNGVGTLCLLSSDVSAPEIHLTHIKKTREVKEVLSQCIETARRENGVRTSELVGGGVNPHHPGDGHDHPSMGPELVPDANHNGVDDRAELGD